MPIFEVETPDGSTIEVEAPEGATQEQYCVLLVNSFNHKKSPTRNRDKL